MTLADLLDLLRAELVAAEELVERSAGRMLADAVEDWLKERS